MILNRENFANSIVMIQPSLISYSFQSAPEPVLLDVAAIAADRMLLLDSYFTVLVFHGVTIAQWRNADYQNQAEHEVTPTCILNVNSCTSCCNHMFIWSVLFYLLARIIWS